MSEDTNALLREIRDNQLEALRLQREHTALYQQQFARAERINDRAEAIQSRGFKAMRIVLWIALPLVIALIVLMLWEWLQY